MADMAHDPLRDLQRELARFARERNWEQYHTPRNLAASISTEAGELLAMFRWGQDAVALAPDQVREELADVFLGVLRLADVAGVDIIAAAREKIALNALRYPVDRTSGPGRPEE